MGQGLFEGHAFLRGQGAASRLCFQLCKQRRMEASAVPEGPGGSGAVPPTCLLGGGGRRGPQRTVVWGGPCWCGWPGGGAAALLGRGHPGSWPEGPCCLGPCRGNPWSHVPLPLGCVKEGPQPHRSRGLWLSLRGGFASLVLHVPLAWRQSRPEFAFPWFCDVGLEGY